MLLPVWDGSHKPTCSLDHPFSLGSKPREGFGGTKPGQAYNLRDTTNTIAMPSPSEASPSLSVLGWPHLRLEVGIQDISDYPITYPISQSCGFFSAVMHRGER